jgi:hypothetical protein
MYKEGKKGMQEGKTFKKIDRKWHYPCTCLTVDLLQFFVFGVDFLTESSDSKNRIIS